MREAAINEVKQFHVKRARPVLAGWSDADLAQLRHLRVELGLPTHEVAERMNRSHMAVRLKLTRLGWVAPYRKGRRTLKTGVAA